MPKKSNHNINNDFFYEIAIEKYGISAQGVNWIDQESQYIRFDIICKLLKSYLTNKSVIADAGCGFGEFYKFLTTFKYPFGEYIGIDSYLKMVSISQNRFPSQQFFHKDILKNSLPQADFYIACGSLNILTHKMFFLFIKRCFESSNKGFIFNFLTKESFNKIKLHEVIGYCSSLTINIKVQQKYHKNDCTILMLKEENCY